jgi:hypothetical protein
MTPETDEWTALQQAWQSRGDRPGSHTVYRQNVDREKRRVILEASLEAIVSLSCGAIFVWWAINARGVETYILIVLAVLSIATLAGTVLLRRTLWRAQADTLAGYRSFLRRRAQLGLLFNRLGYTGGPLGLATGLGLGWTFEFQSAVAGLSNVSLVLAVIALSAACWWAMREARKWRRILDQLGPDDTNAAD